ncbi:MAG: AAA family ATPase [Planctomycetota bacterium]
MAPIVALKGPRQVGKTTILNQTIQALLDSGVPPSCIFRLQFDELPQLRKLSQPILELAWWYSNTILGKSFHKAASEAWER